MTLTQLTYVVALAEHAHFGRAAEACFVSQPTLSMQVQKLEQELGVLLFDRSVQPIRPTGRGQQVVAQARIVLAERDRLFTLWEDAGSPAGTLRIGVIPTVSAYLLPLVAPVLRGRYPDIDLSVEEFTTASLLEHLAAGRLDAGLVATDEDWAGVESVPLFCEAFVGYVSERHALAATAHLRPADLAGADVWLLTEGHCLRDQVMQLCRRSRQEEGRRIRFESGNLETLRHLVDRVGGLTLLPLLATHYLDEEAARHVRHFAAPAPHRVVRLVRPRASVKEPLTAAFAEVLRAAISPLLARLQKDGMEPVG